MLINQDFSVDRTKYIGGSDIGAILGLSKFCTPDLSGFIGPISSRNSGSRY